MAFYFYTGYLAAVNIAALVECIAEIKITGRDVKTNDEITACVISAFGGVITFIAVTFLLRKSKLPWYSAVVYIAALSLHITVGTLLYTWYARPFISTGENTVMSILTEIRNCLCWKFCLIRL